MSDKRPVRLVPARPSADESAAYMPRIPWRVLLPGAAILSAVAVGYLWKEARKADELRASVLRVQEEELGPARQAYADLRAKLEALIVKAAATEPDEFVDKRLHIPGLRSGSGLYLRLALGDADTPEGIARGAKRMEPDLIASCLGLAPTSARGLYEKGEFLTPEWAEETKQLDDVMHLRVRDQVLSRHIRADLPSVLGLLRSDWFLLVLQEGDNRRDAPVRVYLWDLHSGESLLRARVKSQGELLPTHIHSQAQNQAVPLLPEEKRTAGAANDCSIASQIKQLTGTAVAELAPRPSADPPPNDAPH